MVGPFTKPARPDLVVELHADFSKSRKFKSDGSAWEELALLLGVTV